MLEDLSVRGLEDAGGSGAQRFDVLYHRRTEAWPSLSLPLFHQLHICAPHTMLPRPRSHGDLTVKLGIELDLCGSARLWECRASTLGVDHFLPSQLPPGQGADIFRALHNELY